MRARELEPARGSAAEVAGRWQAAASGVHYAGGRWRSRRARGRDARLLRALFARHAVPATGLVLDAACGPGRMADAVLGSGGSSERFARYVGCDVARAMLAEHALPGRAVQASVAALPFADRAFETAVLCRLLHHLADPAERRCVLAELARVTRSWIAVSFWDAGTWRGRRRRPRPAGFPASTRRRDARIAIARAELAEELAAAGAEVVGWRSSFPRFAMQTFALARLAARPGGGAGA